MNCVNNVLTKLDSFYPLLNNYQKWSWYFTVDIIMIGTEITDLFCAEVDVEFNLVLHFPHLYYMSNLF